MKFLPWQLSTFIAFHRGSENCGLEELWRFSGKKLWNKKKLLELFSHAHLSDRGTIKNLISNIFRVIVQIIEQVFFFKQHFRRESFKSHFEHFMENFAESLMVENTRNP